MEKIQIFENQKVRAAWNEAEEKWYFSIVDVCAVLTESADPAKYWRVLKTRLKKEGNETATNCSALKMTALDGKQRYTDVADMEQMLRIIQSIPSKKAEPFKMWLASVGAERIEQLQDPEKSIDQAIADYRKLGYSEAWIGYSCTRCIHCKKCQKESRSRTRPQCDFKRKCTESYQFRG